MDLASSGLKQGFWEVCTAHAVHVYNNTPMQRLNWKTPMELWTGKPPNLSNFRIFGCKAYVHVHKDKRNKLQPKVEEGMFVGYAEIDGSKGYRIWLPHKQSFIESFDVTFDESSFLVNRSQEPRSTPSPNNPDAPDLVNQQGTSISLPYQANDEPPSEDEIQGGPPQDDNNPDDSRPITPKEEEDDRNSVQQEDPPSDQGPDQDETRDPPRSPPFRFNLPNHIRNRPFSRTSPPKYHGPSTAQSRLRPHPRVWRTNADPFQEQEPNPPDPLNEAFRQPMPQPPEAPPLSAAAAAPCLRSSFLPTFTMADMTADVFLYAHLTDEAMKGPQPVTAKNVFNQLEKLSKSDSVSIPPPAQGEHRIPW